MLTLRCMQVCSIHELQRTIEEHLGEAYTNRKYYYSSKDGGYLAVPHQYNSTYYTACNCNDRNYLMARAIQFFVPGIPMVYYVGLLAGENDPEVSSFVGFRLCLRTSF